jgi:hypothetical protein
MPRRQAFFAVTRGTDAGAAEAQIYHSSKGRPPDHCPRFSLADGAKMEASMSPTSLQSERLILADPADIRLARRPTGWDSIVAAVTGPELVALLIFCALGLLATVALNLWVPNFGEVAASLQPMF